MLSAQALEGRKDTCHTYCFAVCSVLAPLCERRKVTLPLHFLDVQVEGKAGQACVLLFDLA